MRYGKSMVLYMRIDVLYDNSLLRRKWGVDVVDKLCASYTCMPHIHVCLIYMCASYTYVPHIPVCFIHLCASYTCVPHIPAHKTQGDGQW